MQRIFKFISADEPTRLPKDHEIVSWNFQHGQLTFWALVPDDYRIGKDDVYREFLILGTGQRVQDDLTHRATLFSNTFVWHVFEKGAS